jgi:hypothetical protein
MKTLPILCSVAALLLVSCAAPIQRRIEKNPKIYSSLTDHQKSLVQHGEIEEGMTKEAVFLSWGSPDRVSSGSRQGKAYERWSYAGYNAVHRTQIGFGVGYAGVGYSGYRGRHSYAHADPFLYTAPSIDYVPFEAAKAEFINGKVTAWSVAQ